ncbi:hypothetical protein AVI51_16960 (plasmid) [Piscirickettsia salmonis]|uniref:Cobyrinic acid ac-diamide synthase n=1 Tax=Piscirickettsia salmonis TaxID=1238 RepID=A0A095CJ31_PISSA|nr:AAA family ATPase [Piscirickettsia salmonis]AKP75067.1 hypothetical protein PSLF89_3p57 [Piscirickettsia salmonis LF-89 = ATCC VR-1361]ALA26588.1 cobyrinic acid ac-diamide synthase [Piscirickettsia salmonis]ALB24424.1 cobyrinic acid ac-diamide synthase [Piscirickettsia salmonis]ALY04612.1 hypothetical protein AWE47_17015 [Piscirickettsia salmonis]AMA43962.1 hypothetical protein AWJ11_16405 [Piscirickettsia salmonis]
MIIVYGGRKGGVGKSSGAINFAAGLQEQGKDVLLFDADRTENSSSWNHIRNENKTLKRVNSVQGYGNILTQLADLSERYDDIVIDTAGKDSQEFRYALAVADIALIPFRCSMFDLKTLPQVSDIISTMRPTNPKLQCFCYISMATTNPIMKEVFQTSQRVEKLKRDGLIDELTFLDSIISDRVAFRNVLFEGKSIYENDDKKAIQEIEDIIHEILNLHRTALDKQGSQHAQEA